MQFTKLFGYLSAIAALVLFYNTALAQTSYTWNGSNSTAWNQPANWTPNGIPASADNVTIPATGTNQLVLDASRSIANLTVSGGTLNLNGYTLTAAGATGSFTGGAVVNGTLQLSLTGAVTFSGTSFGAALTGSAGGLLFNGSTFNNTVSLTKTGSSSDLCTGNNTFNGVTSITNNGASYLRLANSTRDTFHADVTFTNTGTSYIDVARHDANGSLFHGNILVNSISGTGINFGLGTGFAVLAAGKTIGVGNLGFTSGTLALRNFIQEGSTPQSISLNGTATLSFQAGSIFHGQLTAVAPSIALNGSTFNGTTQIEKTGSASNTFTGGNTFNGATTILNSGTNFIRLANSARDIFNADVTFTNTGSSYIDVARHDATGTLFNGHIRLNSISGTGIQFCQGNGTATLAAGKTIQAGSPGFSSGTLAFRNFTQIGNAGQQILLSGSGIVSFQAGNTFNGPVTVEAPGIVLAGTTFNAEASFAKTGTGNNYGTGGNTFNGVATFSNSSTGVFYLNNTGSDSFNDNIVVNSTSGGSIRFGQSTGTATLAAGKTISIGATGFSNGSLMLRNFTQLGSAPVSLTATGTASTISFQANTVLGGDISVVSPGLTLDGATFNGSATFVKTGASSTSAGGNTFNGKTSFTNSGSSFLRLSNTTRDIYNDDVTFTNTGTSYIEVARNDASGTLFNGHIFVNSISGTGIYICPAAGTGTAVLAADKTISVGSTGFTTGGLYLRNFVQTGPTPQLLVLGGTAAQLHFLAGTVFNGSLRATARSLFLSGATFNGSVTLEKTGSTANTGTGGCTFNGAATITNSGSGALTLAGTSGDDFNGLAHFIRRGTGALQPAFNATTTFSGDISTEGSVAAINFANGTNGRIVIDGTAAQHLRGDEDFPPQAQRLTMATDGQDGKLLLHTDLHVTEDLAFTSGIIQAVNTGSADNGLLILHENVTFSDAPHHGSHVSGYVRKIGDTAFTFPTGSGTAYRPIAISAPSLVSDHFTAAYFNTDPDTHYSRTSSNDGISYLSHLEHWILDRTGGNSAATVTLSWDEYSSVSDPKGLLVALWDGTGWVNEGNGGITENGIAGTIDSENEINSFSPFTLGSLYTSFEPLAQFILSPFPVELISFTATPKADAVQLRWKTATETDNAYFTVERSVDGKHFQELHQVKGSGNSSTVRNYETLDQRPLPGAGYYRLKQTDYNGSYKYSAVVAVEVNSRQKQDISLYPNPSDGATITIAAPPLAGQELAVRVLDAQGRMVYNAALPALAANHTIKIEPVQKLNAGVYIVSITGSNGTYSKKLVVQ